MPLVTESKLAGRLLRRAFHTYWRFSRGMTLGVRAAVVDGDERVFLIRHTYVPGWHLPGGGVETGEPVLEALERELREEACIEMTGPPRLHGVFFNRQASPRDHVVVYVVRDFAVTGPKLPDREIAEAGFFPLDRLPEGVTRATRRRLSEILRGEPAGAVW
ncbi:NUDIX domain-containing protein [Microvirga thermotolerans]|uniref:NUDIX domain-containing protein n=2 Tax=Microvirga thermotolerans TaxID=2651334 RepID=A0A5P9K393_9HYPH|nr:NUDIX domain-containing protein [Microvirga thermotolerans]